MPTGISTPISRAVATAVSSSRKSAMGAKVPGRRYCSAKPELVQAACAATTSRSFSFLLMAPAEPMRMMFSTPY